MMEIRVLPDVRAVAAAAVDLLLQRMAAKPDLRVALPAGSTPRPMFAEMVRRHREEGVSFAGLTVFGLDEYRGLAPDAPHAFARFFRTNLLDALDVPEARIHLLQGNHEPALHACRLHEARLLADGGLDLAVVGIGTNGHLAFNEPAPSLVAGTHVATLSAETRAALPPDLAHVTEGLSMGLGSILGARQVLLLATGKSKAEILGRLAQPLISTMLPASLLHVHPDALILADGEAGRLLG
ncbi:MAG: glucosamine-6-phosphate deaminase [Candidatus Sericytochromatia bacterium]|nr:glucosamine-6-phosphate deaminase [Candidatus Sericytochromatia bacterium]